MSHTVCLPSIFITPISYFREILTADSEILLLLFWHIDIFDSLIPEVHFQYQVTQTEIHNIAKAPFCMFLFSM